MLLATSDQMQSYHDMGLWGHERIDQLFAMQAQARPDDHALIDDHGLADASGREPQCLSFGLAWRRAVGLCSFLEGIGMKPDTVVALMLPPCADAAILTLAASRMGLVLAPLPLTSGETEIREKLEQVGAKAIICAVHYEGEPVAERARNVAADMFSIRFVFSIGKDAPEGLIDLQAVLDDEESLPDQELFEHSSLPSADSILAIHWSAAGSLPARPLGRSHNQLLCAAQQVHEQSGLETGDCLMLAHHLSGLAGYASGLIAGLASGARIQFHHFRSLAVMAEMVAEFGVQHILLPGSQWTGLHGLLPMSAREQLKSIGLVWNRHHCQPCSFRDNETAARLMDVTNFGELALYSQIRREPGIIGTVPVGDLRARALPDAVSMQTELFLLQAVMKNSEHEASGELGLKGAMVPSHVFPVAGATEGEALPATQDGFVYTGIACQRIVEEHGEHRSFFRPVSDISDILATGALTERGEDLDALYKSCNGVMDAAAFVAPDPDGGTAHLMAALVVEQEEGAKERFLASLVDKRIASTRHPRQVILVAAIPRFTDGRVQRESLLEAANVSQVA